MWMLVILLSLNKLLFMFAGCQIEETILESLAWRSDSPLWDAVTLSASSLSVEEVFSHSFAITDPLSNSCVSSILNL